MIGEISSLIRFEDKHLVVIDKPAGLLSQGSESGDENLVDFLLRNYFGRHYVGLIHRLDRNTSGLMVVAKRSKAAERLSESLRSGTLIRRYEAWLSGALLSPQHWVHYLWKDEDENHVHVVASSVKGAKRAELHVSPIEAWRLKGGEERTLAGFELATGRSHQIQGSKQLSLAFPSGTRQHQSSPAHIWPSGTTFKLP